MPKMKKGYDSGTGPQKVSHWEGYGDTRKKMYGEEVVPVAKEPKDFRFTGVNPKFD